VNLYNFKIVETPQCIEVWQYEDPIVTCGSIAKDKPRKFEDLSSFEKTESLKRRQTYYQNKRWEIKRIIECNYDNRSSFVTLTYREMMENIDESNYEFKKFIQRLNSYFGKRIKYIATWELQKRGSIHYHVVFFDFQYIKAKTLEKIWQHGFVKINMIRVDHPYQIGLYVSKYFAKDIDVKNRKKKAYFKSRNLRRPTINTFYFPEKNFDMTFDDKSRVYEKKYIATRKNGDHWIDISVRYSIFAKPDTANEQET